MSQPLVTVFIPVFNSEKYIIECIESITNQSYENLEILIIDDGSQDKTIELIESIEDSRIRLLQNDENRGIPYTRNRGLNEARGKYMAIMDSDDTSYLDRIKKQVDFLESNSDIDVVGSFYSKSYSDKKTRIIKTEIINHDQMKYKLMFFSPLSNPSTMVRLSTAKDNNISYNPNYFVAQDYDFWIQISKVGKLSILPEALIEYRTGHDNITSRSKREKLLMRNDIINSIHADILGHYNIKFTEEQLEQYNTLFSQNPMIPLDKNIIKEISIILADWKKNLDPTNQEIFDVVLERSILSGLGYQRMILKDKVNIYKEISPKNSLKSLGKIIAKALYARISGIRNRERV